MDRSRYLRLLPDHTGLLDNDEAFVALGDDQSAIYDLERSSEIVAMRLPSYFKGDLRKLKIVSKAELLQRSATSGSRFFNGVAVGIFLSTKGDTSQAEMMSGGDFDGDRAWCCWEDDIVSHVCDYPAPDTSSELFQQPRDVYKERLMEWTEPQWSKLIITFTWHHRDDRMCLAKLCNALDILRDHPKFGFDSTNEIARKAFIQVDNPHTKQWTRDDEEKYKRLMQPHWCASLKGNKSYRSHKALGVLWDLLEEAGRKQKCEIEDEMNVHIRHRIENAEGKNPKEVEMIRTQMRQRLLDFNKSMRIKIDSSERGDEVGKRLNNNAIKCLYKHHRREIEDSYDHDDHVKVFAILYEQTYFKSRDRMSRFNGEPYVFAWSVGHDWLTRIIADGKARALGLGIAPTVVRGSEEMIFGRKK